MTLAKWQPPIKKIPSTTHAGERTFTPIHTAVGAALSQWEHFESGLSMLFQLLCEATTMAASRAYGTVESCYSKAQMLREAAIVFFDTRHPFDEQYSKEIDNLVAAYENGQKYRNNIAHGMAVSYVFTRNRNGYFLCPPTSATKKHKRAKQPYFENIAYFYDVTDINYCGERFTTLLAENMRLMISQIRSTLF